MMPKISKLERLLRGALFILIACLPLYLLRFNIGSLPSTALEVMVWMVFILWFACMFVIPDKHREAMRDPESTISGSRISRFARFRDDIYTHWPLSLGILLLIITGTVSIFIAPDLRAAAGLWKAYIIEPLALFIVFLTTFKKEDAPKIIFALSLTALATSVFAIYQKFTGFGIPNPYWAAEETRRVTSVWGFPNAVGLFLAPLVPLFVWRIVSSVIPDPAKRGSGIHQFLDPGSRVASRRLSGMTFYYYLLVILSSLLAIIFAKSTGALVGLAAALIITGILYKKTRIATIALTTLGAILVLTAPQLASVKQELLMQNYSGRIRRDMWAESIELLSEHPILGTGLSSYKEVIQRYRIDKWIEIFEYPHNIILNFWIELGALGVLAFILIFYWLFKTTRAAPALLAAFAVILIHGLVDVPYFKNDLAVQFWLLAALCYNTRTYER
ncbi:MAG: O-antigen ligase family protein [Candidatus Magasanikbacteria bacterium]|nr:O-antigen ligase family protein [Candidatus Magasanikbacteria bacterium]